MATKHLSSTFSSSETTLNVTKPLSRFDSQPLCSQGYFSTLEEAANYARTDSHAYVGEILHVISDNDVKSYVIKNTTGDLKQLGSGIEDGDGKAMWVWDESLQAVKLVFNS